MAYITEKVKMALKKNVGTRFFYYKLKSLLMNLGLKEDVDNSKQIVEVKKFNKDILFDNVNNSLKEIVFKSVMLTRIYKKHILKWMHQLGIKQDNYYINNGVSVEQSIQEVKDCTELKKTSNILVAGRLCFTNRISFLNQIAKRMPDQQFIILVENAQRKTSYESIYNFKDYKDMSVEEIRRMKYFIVPGVFIVLNERYPKYKNMQVTKEMRQLISRKEYLQEAVKNLRRRHFDIGTGYPEVFACKAYQYINEMLDELNPKIVVIWNQFHAFHYILDYICKERGFKTMYFEYGVLPGTYAFEAMGQMGESYPAKQYKEFKNLEVLPEECEEAQKIWDYLYTSRLNRKDQPKNNRKDELMSKLMPGRPILFYAGQNDYEAGLYPYTEHTRINHSPVFKSSDAAAIYLAKLSAKNNWNFIYKWHPIMVTYELPTKYPSNLIKIDDIDINEIIDMADLTITILSQTAYISTIRRKPTLILGYMQLRGKGCTYEAFAKEDIEEVIKEALKKGFTEEQSDNFIKHLAQLNKYYLFDDLEDRDMRYGKSVQQCYESILNELRE